MFSSRSFVRCPEGRHGRAGLMGQRKVTINMSLRSAPSSGSAVKHSAYPDLDNCHGDFAQRNARELADLLRAR